MCIQREIDFPDETLRLAFAKRERQFSHQLKLTRDIYFPKRLWNGLLMSLVVAPFIRPALAESGDNGG